MFILKVIELVLQHKTQSSYGSQSFVSMYLTVNGTTFMIFSL